MPFADPLPGPSSLPGVRQPAMTCLAIISAEWAPSQRTDRPGGVPSARGMLVLAKAPRPSLTCATV